MPYIPHSPEQLREMLDIIGVQDLDDLFADISPEMRAKLFDLPPGLSEAEVCQRLEYLASKNRTDVLSFLGGGFYDHYIPKAVDALTGRGEFYTAYTPYQPEASQGTLQAIFEYQTAVCRLLDMDCANASVYDGGSAIFEAMMMAVRQTKRKTLVIDECVSPIYRIMLSSYTSNLNLNLVTVPHKRGCTDMEALAKAVSPDCAAVVVQNPNFFGCVSDFSDLFSQVQDQGALAVMSVYPVMQSVLKTPGGMGADIAVADGQSLGLPLSFGGPYLGVMTCKKKLIRQMPGRIAGRTTELGERGRTGYVLTLQAREQHIRRAKATSNICSNQALCAMRSLVHMSLLGDEGLARTAELGIERAHYAAERLAALPGVEMLNSSPFGNEFAVTLPMSAYEAVDKLAERGVVPGFPLGGYFPDLDNGLLIACTEKHGFHDVGLLAELMGSIL